MALMAPSLSTSLPPSLLQHAKEVCLVGRRKGCPDPAGTRHGGVVGSDVIFSERRGNSQKPTEIYELIEQLVPGGECTCCCTGYTGAIGIVAHNACIPLQHFSESLKLEHIQPG